MQKLACLLAIIGCAIIFLVPRRQEQTSVIHNAAITALSTDPHPTRSPGVPSDLGKTAIRQNYIRSSPHAGSVAVPDTSDLRPRSDLSATSTSIVSFARGGVASGRNHGERVRMRWSPEEISQLPFVGNLDPFSSEAEAVTLDDSRQLQGFWGRAELPRNSFWGGPLTNQCISKFT